MATKVHREYVTTRQQGNKRAKRKGELGEKQGGERRRRKVQGARTTKQGARNGRRRVSSEKERRGRNQKKRNHGQTRSPKNCRHKAAVNCSGRGGP